MNISRKVSVIVPVYNAERHLSFCLDSILNQSYKNIEIIIVNDGSTDESQKILLQYEKKYSDMLKVINKQNSGVSDTRNIGMKYATGYYVMFCDNDDYMCTNLINNLINADDNNYDIVIGGYLRKTYSGKTLFKRKLSQKPLCPYIQLASWGKLYKRSFLEENRLSFLKTAIADDFYFNIFAYNKTDKIKITQDTDYYWMFNDTSLSNTDSKALNRTKDLIYTLNTIKCELGDCNKEILDYFYLRTAIYYILFSCKGVKKQLIYTAYDQLFDWVKANINKNNKYVSLFSNNGEIPTVKCVVLAFKILQKMHIIKPAIFLYSRI